MKTTLSGKKVSRMGQGTWMMAENSNLYKHEIESLRTGIESGINLIDTAEMYADGNAEILVGDSIKGYEREDLYLVSKVYPFNAGRDNIFKSCENSLKRLQTDYLDLYLLHWRGSIPLLETIECMEELKSKGFIRNWGVSNFDLDDMKELLSIDNGKNCITNQLLYHLGSRGIEFDLYPFMKSVNMKLMAYCPLAQAGYLRDEILNSNILRSIAISYNTSIYVIMLSFLLSKELVIPIPRTSKKKHLLENIKALDIELSDEELALLDEEFPAPKYKTTLDIV
ncbi:MAG: aldo/keto reductase [Andreesenia angusta]|nr:aldo/keto reductase [Andreesenia angusta]